MLALVKKPRIELSIQGKMEKDLPIIYVRGYEGIINRILIMANSTQ